MMYFWCGRKITLQKRYNRQEVHAQVLKNNTPSARKYLGERHFDNQKTEEK